MRSNAARRALLGLLVLLLGVLGSFGVGSITAAVAGELTLAFVDKGLKKCSLCELNDASDTSGEAAREPSTTSEPAEEVDTLDSDAEEMGMLAAEPWLRASVVAWLSFQEQIPASSLVSSPQPRPVEC